MASLDGVAHGAGPGVEGGLNLGADQTHRANDGDGDQGGDKAVFNRRDAPIGRRQVSEKEDQAKAHGPTSNITSRNRIAPSRHVILAEQPTILVVVMVQKHADHEKSQADNGHRLGHAAPAIHAAAQVHADQANSCSKTAEDHHPHGDFDQLI